MKSNKVVLLLALGTLMLIEPAMMLYDKQVETVTAEKKNTNAQKTKLSDSQIIKNLGVKKVANSDNDKLTAKYANIVKQQHYTWENPYIKVNPYENSPLTALMVFHTDKPAKISYRVIGKTEMQSYCITWIFVMPILLSVLRWGCVLRIHVTSSFKRTLCAALSKKK